MAKTIFLANFIKNFFVTRKLVPQKKFLTNCLKKWLLSFLRQIYILMIYVIFLISSCIYIKKLNYEKKSSMLRTSCYIVV